MPHPNRVWSPKQSQYWGTEIGGRRYKLAKGNDRRREAEARFHELMVECSLNPTVDSGPQFVTAAALVDEYLDLGCGGNALRTLYEKERVLRVFARELGGRFVKDLKPSGPSGRCCSRGCRRWRSISLACPVEAFSGGVRRSPTGCGGASTGPDPGPGWLRYRRVAEAVERGQAQRPEAGGGEVGGRVLANSREHMRYDEYLAEGYPIGSGMAEGACRHRVKDRMEQSGMRWTVEVVLQAMPQAGHSTSTTSGGASWNTGSSRSEPSCTGHTRHSGPRVAPEENGGCSHENRGSPGESGSLTLRPEQPPRASHADPRETSEGGRTADSGGRDE